MATVLDTGLLNYFLPVFVFIFIFAMLYGLLLKTKILGESKTLNVAVALSIAAMSLFVGKFVSLVSIITPWIIFLGVIMFLVFAIFGFFGRSQENVWKLIGQTPILVLLLIIIIMGISVVFDTTLSPYQVASPESIAVAATASGSNISELTTPGQTNSREQTIKTITHPRVLGALLLLIVAAATMRYLVDKYEESA